MKMRRGEEGSIGETKQTKENERRGEKREKRKGSSENRLLSIRMEGAEAATQRSKSKQKR
jgi:hypothetical protein